MDTEQDLESRTGSPGAGIAAAGSAWRNRIMGAGEEAPSALAANPLNWRLHPKRQQDALAGSLDSVGWVQQVLVNRRTGYVVDGHARVELALARHEPRVPVLYVDLSPEEERLVLATLDPIGALASADTERLSGLLAQVSAADAGLQALLDGLAVTAPRVGLRDPDEVPALPSSPTSGAATSTPSGGTACCAAMPRTPTMWLACSMARGRPSLSLILRMACTSIPSPGPRDAAGEGCPTTIEPTGAPPGISQPLTSCTCSTGASTRGSWRTASRPRAF